MQRIRDIFNIANFFNDRGGGGGRSGGLTSTLKWEGLWDSQPWELSPLSDPARHNKPVDPNPEQFG